MSHGITKTDVARVRKQLMEEGKKPTMEKLRIGLGGTGSYETIHKYKRELDEEDLASKDSPEALKSFRGIWLLAVQEGISQRDVEIEELQEVVRAVSGEAAQLRTEVAAARLQAENAAKKLEDTTLRLNGTIDELARARDTSERYAAKLVEAGELHSQELNGMRDQAKISSEQYERELGALRHAAEKASAQHAVECGELRDQLEKNTNQHLMEVDKLHQQIEKMVGQHREDLKDQRNAAAKANEQHQREIHGLRELVDKEKDRANELHVRLTRAEAQLEIFHKARTLTESGAI